VNPLKISQKRGNKTVEENRKSTNQSGD